MHPSATASLTLLAENDGWDWNAGVVAEWRGVTFGVYGTELEAGRRKGEAEGFNVYNYTKFNFALGYTGNVRDISHGVVLRSRITEMTREQRRLRTEIVVARATASRRLEGAARRTRVRASSRSSSSRRQQLEIELQAEREAIKRATDRLKELEQGGRPAPQPPTKPPRIAAAGGRR